MKNKLSITQAAKICGYQRTYFYKIIDKYNISIKKDSANKSYIDPSELVRSVPGEMINNDLLAECAEIQTQTDDTNRQKPTQEYKPIFDELRKKEKKKKKGK